MSEIFAKCRFCSRTDNSIQVICEARCLICSRCQLMPGIRSLLIDHSNTISLSSNVVHIPGDNSSKSNSNHYMEQQQQQQVAKMGACPICELPMAPSMRAIIRRFKENQGKITSDMVLEESTDAIKVFLKRYRSLYLLEEVKGGTASEKTLPSVNHSSAATSASASASGVLSRKKGKGKPPPSIVPKTMDVYTTGPLKETMQSINEFITDCYCAHWASILRNGNESMLTVMFRMTNKKKLSQRTNDLKTKAVLDFMMNTSSAGNETTPDTLLFGFLIGIQPKLRSIISPAWSHVAVAVLVVAHCDRCLKMNQLNDQDGNPSASELRSKLSRSLSYPKIIPVKKALKIIELLLTTKHPYWNISPLTASCIEHNTKLPWDATSISKLLNVLFYVVFYEGINKDAETGANASLHGVGSSTSSKRPVGSINRSSQSLPIIDPILSANQNTANASMSSDTISISSSNSSTVVNSVINSISSSVQHQNRVSSRVNFLRSLEYVTYKVWHSKPDNQISRSEDVQKWIDFLGSIDQPSQERTTFMNLDFERSYLISENMTISLTELAFVCAIAWNMEYNEIKDVIATGSVNSKRRKAVSSSYDSSLAKMNATEKLAIRRIVKMYKSKVETKDVSYNTSRARGYDWIDIDWDEVLESISNRSLPFSAPKSLLTKSHNELNYLMKLVISELKSQEENEEIEDLLVEFGPYSNYEQGIPSLGNWELIMKNIGRMDIGREGTAYIDTEGVNRAMREEFLSKQTLGAPSSSLPIQNDILVESKMLEIHSRQTKRQTEQLTALDEEMRVIHNSRPSSSSAVRNLGSNLLLKPKSNPQLHPLASTTDVDVTARVNAFLTEVATPAAGLITKSDPYSSEIQGEMTPRDNQQLIKMANSFNNGNEKTDRQRNQQSAFESIRSIISGTNTAAATTTRTDRNARSTYAYGESGDDLGVSMADVIDPQLKEILFREYLEKLRSDEVNQQYQQKLEMMKQAKLNAARSRVKLRIAKAQNIFSQSSSQSSIKMPKDDEPLQQKLRYLKGVTVDNMNDDQSFVNLLSTNTSLDVDMATFQFQNSLDSNKHNHGNNYGFNYNRLTKFLDLTQFINASGEFTIDTLTHATVEKANLVLSVKNVRVTMKTFQILTESYLQKWQLGTIVKLDLSGMALGLAGALLLSNQLSLRCQLIHINLNSFRCGDMGLKKILSAVIAGEGHLTLLRLDLNRNDITIATDAFSLLANFTNLKSLDLSYNCFALDTTSQNHNFVKGISTLTKLESLSLAYNKIQDKGFEVIYNVIQNNGYRQIRILDVAGCFLSGVSIPKVMELYRLSDYKVRDHKLRINANMHLVSDHGGIYSAQEKYQHSSQFEEIMVQDNVFTLNQRQEMINEAEKLTDHSCKLLVEETYIGIAYPLRYDPNQYGMDAYML